MPLQHPCCCCSFRVCLPLTSSNMFLLLEAELTYRRERLSMYLEYLNSPGLIVRRRQVHKPRAPRRFWVKPGRTRSWWDSFVSNIVPLEEWRDNYRMTRGTFYSLIGKLGSYIEGQPTKMHEPVEVDRQVALTLYYLADESCMRKTANAFGLSRSSVSIIVRKVCRAPSEHLGPQLTRLPTIGAGIKEKVALFSYQYSLIPTMYRYC